MQRVFTFLSLTFLIFTFFVLDATHANNDVMGNLDTAEKNEVSDLRDANTAYDNLQYSNSLYLMAQSEYNKNREKIERGVGITAAK